MKQKSTKIKKTRMNSNKITQVERSVYVVPINEEYQEINQTSFQQNFKFLLGHYKEGGQDSQAR